MAFGRLVGDALKLHVSPHRRTDPLDDRLMNLGHNFHLRQVGQKEKLLSLPHRHSGLDKHLTVGVVGVNHEAVVRRTNGAMVDLLLQAGQYRSRWRDSRSVW